MKKPEIYTSYYAKLGEFNPDEFIRIQISRGCPVPDMIDLKWMDLMPSSALLAKSKDGFITDDEYIQEYEWQLESITFEVLQSQFNKLLTTNKNLVLLCYESPEKFCHRHVLADWYNNHADHEVIKEFKFI